MVREKERGRGGDGDRWTERERKGEADAMLYEIEGTSLIDIKMLKLLISTTCFLRRIDLLFATVVSPLSQSCFSVVVPV